MQVVDVVMSVQRTHCRSDAALFCYLLGTFYCIEANLLFATEVFKVYRRVPFTRERCAYITMCPWKGSVKGRLSLTARKHDPSNVGAEHLIYNDFVVRRGTQWWCDSGARGREHLDQTQHVLNKVTNHGVEILSH
jgi:hypothetical protein